MSFRLVQELAAVTNGSAPSWPRIRWRAWKTPTGEPWTFGEVRAGTNSLPGKQESFRVGWNAIQRVVQQGASK